MADYDQYRRMLPVQKHRLDDELELQAQIMEHIGSECARLESRARALKDELEREEARIAVDLREDGQKRTVDETKGQVQRNKSRVAAFERYEMARLDWQKWERLYDSWKTRDFSVRALGKLFGDGYFANDPIVGKERERRDAEYRQRREKISEARDRNRATGDDEESMRYRAGELFEREQEPRPTRRRAEA